jgi:hypothetical protein
MIVLELIRLPQSTLRSRRALTGNNLDLVDCHIVGAEEVDADQHRHGKLQSQKDSSLLVGATLELHHCPLDRKIPHIVH